MTDADSLGRGRRSPSKRTRSSRLLREVGHQLNEAAAILADSPSEEAVSAALTRLTQAREALSQIMLERAGGSARAEGRPETTPAVIRRMLLDVGPESPQLARSFCRQTCQRWSLPETVVNAATDIASELVANGVRGAKQPLLIALELGTEHLLVRVWDDAPGTPRLLPYRPGISEHGIGLRLVKQLSSAWGWTEEQAGKWVWARIALTTSPVAPPRGSGAADSG